MSKEQPMLYDLTYFDAQGQKLDDGQKHWSTLSNEEPREMQFMAAAARHPEVNRYEARLLRPEEIKLVIKAEKRQALQERITDHVMEQFETYGFDIDTDFMTMLHVAKGPMI